MAEPLLQAEGIVKRFGHVSALQGANLTIAPGEVHALLGDNGAGKSTLVKVVAGVQSADEGTLRVAGEIVNFHLPSDAQDAGIETVYQDLALAPTLPPGENIYLGRELMAGGVLGAQLPSDAAPVVGLSGGQRQAVAIARALAWGARLIIMDEPTAALGVRQREFVLDLITKVRDERGMSVLLISHSLPDVFRVADRITVLRLGQDVLSAPAADLDNDSILRAMTGAEEVGR
jgi:ABC-type sugar transport system ATPase subunit